MFYQDKMNVWCVWYQESTEMGRHVYQDKDQRHQPETQNAQDNQGNANPNKIVEFKGNDKVLLQ